MVGTSEIQKSNTGANCESSETPSWFLHLFLSSLLECVCLSKALRVDASATHPSYPTSALPRSLHQRKTHKHAGQETRKEYLQRGDIHLFSGGHLIVHGLEQGAVVDEGVYMHGVDLHMRESRESRDSRESRKRLLCAHHANTSMERVHQHDGTRARQHASPMGLGHSILKASTWRARR